MAVETRGGLILPPQEIAQVRTHITDKIIRQTGPFIKIIFEHEMIVEEKENGEPTSPIDRDVTSLVRELWEPRFPRYPILAEDYDDPRLAGLSPEEIMALEGVLVLDGIDGSGMMYRHSKIFSTSLGFMSYGQIVAGVVHRPIGNRLWVAQDGVDGAFRDGQRLRLSKVDNLAKAVASTAYAWNRELDGERARNLAWLNEIGRLLNQPGFNRASSVLDMIKVAEAQNDLHFSCGLKPWDLGAAPFIAQKLGALVTDAYGNPFNIFSKTIVIANNERTHQEFLGVIQQAEQEIDRKKMREELLLELQQENATLQGENRRLKGRRGLFLPESVPLWDKIQSLRQKGQ